MSALIVDTSVWIEYFRGSTEYPIIDSSLKQGSVYLPVPIVGELLSGRLTKRRRSDLEQFLSELPLIGASLADWKNSGALRAFLSDKGLSVSMIDTHIAASAIAIEGALLTRDLVFKKIALLTSLRLEG